MSYLENTGEGISRYPDQQILYQWKKHEQRAELPYGAYYGQCDPFANGDEWIMLGAGAGITGPALLTPVDTYELDNANTKLTRAYSADDTRLYVSNGQDFAITEDLLVGDAVYINYEYLGRITSNGAAAAASGGTYPEFWIELEYPFSVDISITTDKGINTVANQWKSVKTSNVATDKIVAVLPDKLTITSGYAFWGKKHGSALLDITTTDVAKGAALQLAAGNKLEAHTAGNQIIAIADKAATGATVQATLALGM